MKPKDQFAREGMLHVTDVITPDLCELASAVLLRSGLYNNITEDDQVPRTIGRMSHEYLFETLQEMVWHKIEALLEEELLPTYSYARLYTNGNDLKKHSDRPSCEISVTIQLARTHHYAWPIYMAGKRFDMAEGDGLIYKGCELEHWRDKCDGPENYMSGQCFMHFVRKQGIHYQHAGDREIRETRENLYLRGRQLIWRSK